MNEQDLRWNKFIEEICYRDINKLSEIQKKAVLCFWYDTEMNNGGHSGYFYCYPETKSQELVSAIIEVSYKEIADNYLKAISEGINDDYEETDSNYYNFEPSLCDCLQDFIEKNKYEIFN